MAQWFPVIDIWALKNGHAKMATKFGGQILATKFGFVPDLLCDCILSQYRTDSRLAPSQWETYCYKVTASLIGWVQT